MFIEQTDMQGTKYTRKRKVYVIGGVNLQSMSETPWKDRYHEGKPCAVVGKNQRVRWMRKGLG